MDDTTREASVPETDVVELLQATYQLIRRLRAEETGAAGLSWSQTSALFRLERQGPMTTADLARADLVKPQSMGATLAALERLDLVRREPHPTDGRQVLFALTDKGRRTRERNRLLKRRWLGAALSGLEPQERQTLAQAAALFKRLAQA